MNVYRNGSGSTNLIQAFGFVLILTALFFCFIVAIDLAFSDGKTFMPRSPLL